ncbi:MAG: glycosyltransferase [Bacteroidetes bacterium]|nr:glycosyltransferase [Bacteroidota bacterium]
MDEKPEITVITATYNSSQTLFYTLKSLLNQTFQKYEAWIIGDGCADDSEKIVMSFSDKRLHWFNRKSNSGRQGAPNNDGLRRARGKYIAYLGHDDLWLPHHLATLHKIVTKENIDFAYPITAGIGPNRIEYVYGQSFYGLSFDNFMTPPSSWFHRKDLIDKIGFWSENYLDLSETQDKDFFTRAYKSGATMRAIPRLSVIKFPSPSWKSYKKRTELKKAIETYWTKIEVDSDRFLVDLLTQITFEYSRYNDQMIMPPIKCLRMVLKYFYHEIINFYGRNRFPLKNFLHFLNQRRRVRIDKIRGL